MKVETPLLVPVLAALPVSACMVILGLPAASDHYIVAFRTLFLVACLLWLVPLTLLQRAMWRRDWSWLRMGSILLATTYAMDDMIAELRTLTNRDAMLRLRDGSELRASRCYMPALTEALRHLNAKKSIRSPTWRHVC